MNHRYNEIDDDFFSDVNNFMISVGQWKDDNKGLEREIDPQTGLKTDWIRYKGGERRNGTWYVWNNKTGYKAYIS